MSAIGAAMLALLLLSPFILGVLASWDMGRRGEMGWVYGLFVFLCLPVGLIVWLVASLQRPILDRAPRQVSASQRFARVVGGALVLLSGVLLIALGPGASPIVGAVFLLIGSLAAIYALAPA